MRPVGAQGAHREPRGDMPRASGERRLAVARGGARGPAAGEGPRRRDAARGHTDGRQRVTGRWGGRACEFRGGSIHGAPENRARVDVGDADSRRGCQPQQRGRNADALRRFDGQGQGFGRGGEGEPRRVAQGWGRTRGRSRRELHGTFIRRQQSEAEHRRAAAAVVQTGRAPPATDGTESGVETREGIRPRGCARG